MNLQNDIQKDIQKVKAKIENLRIEAAAEEKFLSRLIEYSKRTQPPKYETVESPRTSKLPITKQIEEIMRESDKPMTIQEIKKILIKRGATSKSKQGLNAVIASVLFKRNDIFRRVDRGVYEMIKEQKEFSEIE